MNRINTGRQTISAKQRNCNYRPSGAIAQHVLDATVVDETACDAVSYRLASEAFTVGAVSVATMQAYYLVASKFAGRSYVVAELNGTWVSSSKDERVATSHIAKVQEYRQAALVA